MSNFSVSTKSGKKLNITDPDLVREARSIFIPTGFLVPIMGLLLIIKRFALTAGIFCLMADIFTSQLPWNTVTLTFSIIYISCIIITRAWIMPIAKKFKKLMEKVSVKYPEVRK